MLVTLALVVFFSSIVVFFSDEFIRSFKKLFAIKGTKLFLPLLVASWLVYTIDYWVLWAISYYQEMMHTALLFLLRLLPLHQGAKSLALILLLTTVSVLPVLVLEKITRRNTYKSYRYPYVTSSIIWLISAILLTVL